MIFLRNLIHFSFQAGQLIRDTVVDGAVLYYTGESVDDDDFGFDDGEDHEGKQFYALN